MELITKISVATDSRLLILMERRFQLSTHLLALKKFMLLGQGDFVTCLMDSVGPELKKRANQLYRHNLTGILEGALRSSNAQFEPPFVIDRIGVRLLEASPGDSGWEVFSLDYIVDSPLNAVVHLEAMSRYRIAFHMLWRLKRVEWSLSGIYIYICIYIYMNFCLYIEIYEFKYVYL
jgi:gamma-tubulin complex component 3